MRNSENIFTQVYLPQVLGCPKFDYPGGGEGYEE